MKWRRKEEVKSIKAQKHRIILIVSLTASQSRGVYYNSLAFHILVPTYEEHNILYHDTIYDFT